MQVQRSRRKKRNPFLKAVLVLALISGASFGLALMWQAAEERVPERTVLQQAFPAESKPASTATSPVPEEALPEEEPEEAALPAEEETSSRPTPGQETSSKETPAQEASSAESKPFSATPTTTAGEADNSYFDDALFIGDSISTGIPLYHIADNAATVAFTGINTNNINTREVIDTPNGRVTMLEAAKSKGSRGKIYIMLGSNSLDLDKESFIQGYRTFVLSVKEAFPGAVIYLQSMTPVTENVQKYYKNPNVNNERIREYNEAIAELAKSVRVEYLNIYEALANENGMLPNEASPTDGMHFSPEYYTKWFDYLKQHTAEVKK